MMSKHSSLRYVLIKKNTSALAGANQKNNFWGVPGGVATPNYVLIFVSKISTADIKKHWHRKLSPSKNWFWGDFRGGQYPQTML